METRTQVYKKEFINTRRKTSLYDKVQFDSKWTNERINPSYKVSKI